MVPEFRHLDSVEELVNVWEKENADKQARINVMWNLYIVVVLFKTSKIDLVTTFVHPKMLTVKNKTSNSIGS